MRYAKNPVAQFLAAGLLVLVVVVLGTVQLSRHAADVEAINDARRHDRAARATRWPSRRSRAGWSTATPARWTGSTGVLRPAARR